MKLKKLLILPAVLVFSACSATYSPETDQNSNYDFSSIKTFHVIGDKNLQMSAISDINRERIDTAIMYSLTEQGMQASDQSSADVLIQYFIVAKDKVKINTMYNGYYGRYNGLHFNNIAHVSTQTYVEGTLVIDVIDYSSKKSVWRSTLTKPLNKHQTPEERDQVINNLVRAMFIPFPSHHANEKKT